MIGFTSTDSVETNEAVTNDLVKPRTGGGAIQPWQARKLTLPELLDRLFARKQAATVEAYRKDLLAFSRFLGEEDSVRGMIRFLSMGKAEGNAAISDYQESLNERGLAPQTINRAIAPIKTVLKAARAAGLVDWAIEIEQMPQENVKDTSGPGIEAIKDMLQWAYDATQGRVWFSGREVRKDSHKVAVRNYAILRFLADLGLRRGALVHAKAEALQDNTITLRLKGGKLTPFEIPAPTMAALAAWLEIRGTEPGPLFYGLHPSTKKTAITGKAIYGIVRDVAAEVGVEVPVKPHGIRHSTITDIIKHEGIYTAQHFARHKDAKTTSRYDDQKTEVGNAAAAGLAQRLLVKDREGGT